MLTTMAMEHNVLNLNQEPMKCRMKVLILKLLCASEHAVLPIQKAQHINYRSILDNNDSIFECTLYEPRCCLSHRIELV